MPRFSSARFPGLVLLVASLLFCGQVRAAPLVGAGTLDLGEHGLYATAGLPDVEAGAVFGLSSLTDVAVRARVQYGTGSHLGGIGVRLGAGLRLQLADLGGGWRLTGVAEPGLQVHKDAEDWAPTGKTESLVTLDSGVPGLVLGTTLAGGLHLAVGVLAPIRLHVAPEPTLELALLGHLAAEAPLTDRVALLALADLGGALYGPGAGTGAADPVVRVRLGVAWR